MARPRVADRGDSLQIWRIPANILNKQSRTDDSGWPSLGVGRGANNPHHKLNICYEELHTASYQDGLFAEDRDRWRAVVNAEMNLGVLAPRS
jgi:hypothetical protein